MRILVTGGAGFLGSHLCESLVDRGDHVTCFDNLTSGSINNIAHLEGPNFELTKVINAGERFDQIYHLASPAAPAMIQKYPDMTEYVNHGGTRILLNNVASNKFLFVSTVKVHGDCERVQPYITGKRGGESICLARGLKVARLANSYGPRMALDDSRVIPTFIRRALLGEPLSLWNGGEQTDSFCYVSDVIRGLIAFMDSKEKGVIEFGAKEGIKIKDLAALITGLCGGDPVPFLTESIPVSDDCHQLANLTRAKTLLGWEPYISITKGLTLTIECVRDRLGNRRAA